MKIILGTMDILHEKMQDVINDAGKLGYELIDTAWIYQNEKVVGEAVYNYNLKNSKKLKLQTKIWPDFYDDIENKFQEQLNDLKVDKIYSVLLHRPSLDFNLTIKAWKFLIKQQKMGIIEKIGVSNFDKDMIKILVGLTNVKPSVNQIELSVHNFRLDRTTYLKKENINIQAWSVMGNNFSVLKNKTVLSLATTYNCLASDIAISYLTSQNISVVVKASSKLHLKQNLNAKNIKLKQEDLNLLLKENIFDNKFEESLPHSF